MTILVPVEQLRTTGLSLYGDDWQSPLARALPISARMMRYYANGIYAIPDRVLSRLPELLRQVAADRRASARDLEHLAASLS